MAEAASGPGDVLLRWKSQTSHHTSAAGYQERQLEEKLTNASCEDHFDPALISENPKCIKVCNSGALCSDWLFFFILFYFRSAEPGFRTQESVRVLGSLLRVQSAN